MASEQECGVCIFPLCLHGLSLGSLAASSHTPKICIEGGLDLYIFKVVEIKMFSFSFAVTRMERIKNEGQSRLDVVETNSEKSDETEMVWIRQMRLERQGRRS